MEHYELYEKVGEDYCSYELMKLINKTDITSDFKSFTYINRWIDDNESYMTWSHSLVMKALRRYGVCVNVSGYGVWDQERDRDWADDYNYKVSVENIRYGYQIFAKDGFGTYCDAVEAGLKHAFKNYDFIFSMGVCPEIYEGWADEILRVK